MIMHSITVLSTATFFYCVPAALASHPDKLKLYVVPRKAATASLDIQKSKGEASKLLFHGECRKKLPTPSKSQHIKVKKES